jgi:hypothetical protein
MIDSEMEIKYILRKPEYPVKTTDLPQVTDIEHTSPISGFELTV